MGSLPYPWVEPLETGDVVEVPVTGDRCEVVLQGCCRDEDIERPLLDWPLQAPQISTQLSRSPGDPPREGDHPDVPKELAKLLGCALGVTVLRCPLCDSG